MVIRSQLPREQSALTTDRSGLCRLNGVHDLGVRLAVTLGHERLHSQRCDKISLATNDSCHHANYGSRRFPNSLIPFPRDEAKQQQA
jgi:hypothetical protein